MPTEEEIATQKAADDAAAKEAAEKDAAEAKELGLGDKGKEAIERERDARKAAEKVNADLAKEVTRLRQAQTDADAAKAKADEEEATKKGEFEKLATDRGDKLKERDATIVDLTATVQRYETRDRQRIETGIKDIPDDLKEFDPGPDAPLETRLAWFEKAVAQTAKRAGDQSKSTWVNTPRPNGRPGDAQEAEKQRLRANANYGI